MNLSDRMVYAGIRTSRRFAQLGWMQRDFFYGLLNVADALGRFEADVEVLRAALYAPILSKVSKRDVQGALVACQRAGLVKLWTGVDGRGYGEVVNYRQTGLRNRKSDIPPPDAPDAGALPGLMEATADPPDPPTPPAFARRAKRRKEENGVCVARGARHGREAPEHTHTALTLETIPADLADRWPGIDLRAALRRAEAYVRQQRGPSARVALDWFEDHWLPKEPVSLATPAAPAAEDPAPEGWQAVIAETQYGPGGAFETHQWAALPEHVREHVRRTLNRAA